MTWDPIWEQIFRERDWGRYPPEELIRFVARYFYRASDRGQIKILEIGCGPGANIWFLAREGFDAYGIDGSETAIAKAERALKEEGLKARLQVGDINSLCRLYPSSYFDALVDVACLQCNGTQAIETILDQAVTILKPQGKIFSMMVADGSYGDGLGKELEPGTFVEISEGPLQSKGISHFSNLEEVQRLFGRFRDVGIEYSTRSLENQRKWYKLWVIEAVKQL